MAWLVPTQKERGGNYNEMLRVSFDSGEENVCRCLT